MNFNLNKSLILGAATVVLSCCNSVPPKNTTELNSDRGPASTKELIDKSQKILNDLNNTQIFNENTCPVFLNKVTDYLYNLPAYHFIPKTPDEVELFKARGSEVIDTIFQIRVVLHEKLQDFDKRNVLSKECMLEIREGFQYARYTEEYILDWLHGEKVFTFDAKKPEPILSNKKPATWTNPKFAGFELQSGDIMLIRGKSYVSAMIARIADEEGNFSHLAIVGEDSKGKKYVVEALIQFGVIVTPLEKWRKAEDSRVALYRMPDKFMALKAARVVYERAQAALDRKKGIRYDFAMNDDDYSTWFCSETVRYAYDTASNGQIKIPKFRSTVSKFKNTNYPGSLGVTKPTLFAPYDIEVDPRFDLVAEYRHFPLLRQVRMQDAVLQSVYEWMIKKDYTYFWSPKHSAKAYLAKIVRQVGIAADTLPTYMPMNSIIVNIQFQAVATALEHNLYAKEEEYRKKHGHLPSFKDMLQINEDYRRADCLLEFYKREPQKMANGKEPIKFHSFFYNPEKKCF